LHAGEAAREIARFVFGDDDDGNGQWFGHDGKRSLNFYGE
jgi:hypothetical protein